MADEAMELQETEEIARDENALEGANLHRYDEFEDLRDKLDRVLEKLDVLKTSIEALTLDVATVQDDSDDSDDVIEDEEVYEAIEDLDLSI